MKQFTSQEIEARFEQLPPEVQAAVTAPDIGDKLEEIAKKHGLHVDQFGEMVDETGMIMMGLRRSEYFIPDLCSRLSIDRTKAQAIANDISLEFFSAIKKHLMEMQEKIPNESIINSDPNRGWGNIRQDEKNAENKVERTTDIEKIGDFTIERDSLISDNTSDQIGPGAYVEKRSDILSSIERPKPAPRKILSNDVETKTEPLIDHLLTTPNIVPPAPVIQKIVAQANTISTKISEKPRSVVPDPYREPTN